METLSSIGKAVRPYLVPLLIVLAVIVLVVAVVLLVRWWQARKKAALPAGADEVIASGRLLDVRRKFIAGLPFRYRSTVDDFATTVVMGPAGAGKSRVIDAEVDWRRQANQFMPSYTEDPLLQIYLGPDVVVQELSAPLMEDGSPEARRAFTRLWNHCFDPTEPMVIIVLDVKWITQTPPDEVRRVTQLLRGKINIIAEIVETTVETRICLTHLDELEGYEDFARLLFDRGVPLDFTLPESGQEALVADCLKPYEQYLAVALTSLTVEAFERLEVFFGGGGKVMEALSRFVIAFREGGAMARPPQLSKLYLFSPTPEARSQDVFDRPRSEEQANTRSQYLRGHLKRCAAILAVGTLPILGVYANMYYRVNHARDDVAKLRDKVDVIKRDKQSYYCRSLAEAEVHAAVRSYEALSQARRFWPPLRSSFSDANRRMRADVAGSVRDCFLTPFLDRCQDECSGGESCKPSCSREQALYMLALIYSSRSDDLGRFILRQKGAVKDEFFADIAEVLARASDRHVQFENLGDFSQALELPEELIATYVGASDAIFSGSWHWRQMPFHKDPEDVQFRPWLEHFNAFEDMLRLYKIDRAQWDVVRAKGRELQQSLKDSQPFRSAQQVHRLLQDSVAPVEPDDIAGLDARLAVLQWEEDNRAALGGYFRMQEQAEHGYQLAGEMSWAELLTRSDGLFVPGDATAHYDFQVLERPFSIHPAEVSHELLEKLLHAEDESGKLAFVRNAATAESRGEDGDLASFDENEDDEGSGRALMSVVNRAVFESDVRPKIEEFTRRMATTRLPASEASQRVEYVLGEMEWFARDYARALRAIYEEFQFRADSRDELHRGLVQLGLPASPFNTSLREVAHRADLGKLEGPYFERIRHVVTPYAPIVNLMKPNKDGTYAELDKYMAIVSQFDEEVFGAQAKGGRKRDAAGAAGAGSGGGGAAAGSAAAGGGAGAPGGGAGTAATAGGGAAAAPGGGAAAGGKPRDDKTLVSAVGGGAPGGGAAAPRSGSGPRLEALLSPLGQAALPMLLEDEGNYLKRVDAWLDEEHIAGNLRRRFRQPFEVAAAIGEREIEQVIRRQWEERHRTLLAPLLARFPFDPRAREEIDPLELDVLQRKDGRFWEFVDRVIAPLMVEDAMVWTLKRPLADRFALPDNLLDTLNHFDRIAHLLWDEEGNRKPLALQVRPLPLPNKQVDSYYVTMSYLKAGPVFVFGYNQQPAWQDFPLVWWNQEAASVGLQRTSPDQPGKKYKSIDVSGRGWSFYRLIEKASLSLEKVMTWRLPITADDANIPKKQQIAEVSFGLRGDPWAPFRRR